MYVQENIRLSFNNLRANQRLCWSYETLTTIGFRFCSMWRHVVSCHFLIHSTYKITAVRTQNLQTFQPRFCGTLYERRWSYLWRTLWHDVMPFPLIRIPSFTSPTCILESACDITVVRKFCNQQWSKMCLHLGLATSYSVRKDLLLRLPLVAVK